MPNLDEYTFFSNDKELEEQLNKLGINKLKDLSDKAQLEKQREWERVLAQGRRRKIKKEII